MGEVLDALWAVAIFIFDVMLTVPAMILLFIIIFCLLLADTLFSNPLRRISNRSGYYKFELGETQSIWDRLKTVSKSSLLLVSIVSFQLLISSIRRGLMGASLGLVSLWIHSAASVLDLIYVFIITRFIVKAPIGDLGLPRNPKSLISIRLWAQRLLIAGSIVFITYSVLPMAYFLTGCMTRYTITPLFGTESIFHALVLVVSQLICLGLSAIDEETGTRGLVHLVWLRNDYAKWLMLITSGILFASQHVQTSAVLIHFSFGDIIGLILLTVNYVFQGAVHMLLFVSTEDLVGNYVLHFIGELVEMWFGPRTISAYAIPYGQFAAFDIGCQACGLMGWRYGVTASIGYTISLVFSVGVVMMIWYSRHIGRKSE